VRGMDFAAEDVDEPGVLEEQLGGLFAARDLEFMNEIAHARF